MNAQDREEFIVLRNDVDHIKSDVKEIKDNSKKLNDDFQKLKHHVYLLSKDWCRHIDKKTLFIKCVSVFQNQLLNGMKTKHH